eukprot:TRINITY_DN862_c1_g1_i4.p1 TRINITY_DN862_c1_g1~~TRINITY_DN862_c1_g1_i4.p1  ORF type:complete len:354 (+),score=53.52 TRINITY_DN862_c1_g1_i4:191-1252(+)
MFQSVSDFLSPHSKRGAVVWPREDDPSLPPSTTNDSPPQIYGESASEPVTPVATPGSPGDSAAAVRRQSLPVPGEKRRSFSFLRLGGAESEGGDVCDSSDFSGSPPASPRSAVKSEVEKLLLEVETKFFFWREKDPREHDELYQQYSTRAASSFQDAAKSGNLTKLGKIHKTWRERYFVLDGSLMFYYDSPRADRPKGVIDLAGCEVLRDRTRGKNHCFQVSHKNRADTRTFVFFSKNEEDMRSWLRELVRAADAAHTASTPHVKRQSRSQSQTMLKETADTEETENNSPSSESEAASGSRSGSGSGSGDRIGHSRDEKGMWAIWQCGALCKKGWSGALRVIKTCCWLCVLAL